MELKDIIVTNIEWDTDGMKIKGLPEEVLIEASYLEDYIEDEEDFEDIEDIIGDILSNHYGWCLYGFNYEFC